jgi:hypothetical protein
VDPDETPSRSGSVLGHSGVEAFKVGKGDAVGSGSAWDAAAKSILDELDEEEAAPHNPLFDESAGIALARNRYVAADTDPAASAAVTLQTAEDLLESLLAPRGGRLTDPLSDGDPDDDLL